MTNGGDMCRYDQEKGFFVHLTGYPGRGEHKEYSSPDRFHDTDEESKAHQLDRIIESATDDDRLWLTECQQTSAFYSRQPFDY